MKTSFFRLVLLTLTLASGAAQSSLVSTSYDGSYKVEGIRLGVEVGGSDLLVTAFDLNLETSIEPWSFTISLFQGDVTAGSGLFVDSWSNLPYGGEEIYSSGAGLPSFVDSSDFLLAANTNYYFEFILNHEEYNANHDINKSLMIVSSGEPGRLATDRTEILSTGDITLLEGSAWKTPTGSPGYWEAESAAFDGGVHFTLVPVPAAVWLFASALLGLAGLRKFRATQ